MTDDPTRPPPGVPHDDFAEPEAPPPAWRPEELRAGEERDPERGQHLIWVALAAALFLIAWWTSSG